VRPNSFIQFLFGMEEDEEDEEEEVVIDAYPVTNDELLDAGVTSGTDTGAWDNPAGPGL
jgi:hypothetical protein